MVRDKGPAYRRGGLLVSGPGYRAVIFVYNIFNTSFKIKLDIDETISLNNTITHFNWKWSPILCTKKNKLSPSFPPLFTYTFRTF